MVDRMDDSSSDFDVEAYISGYVGHTKVRRLLFIANSAGSEELELQALKLAADEVQTTVNMVQYREVMKAIDGRLGPDYMEDKAWLATNDEQYQERKKQLGSDLTQHKTNTFKENIRTSYLEMGDFFFQYGELQMALKHYIRMKDYCTQPKHHYTMCLRMLHLCIEMDSFKQIPKYIEQGRSLLRRTDAKDAAKLHAAAGLQLLDEGKYSAAARSFVTVEEQLADEWREVILPADVALYGSLCGLASFDRQELKARIIDNICFREFLEVMPEVREVVRSFYNSQYGSCLAALEGLRRRAQLDVHLADHVEVLYRHIRSRALVQFAAPYASLRLSDMANAFNTSISGIEKELAGLISDGSIAARIDSHNKALYAQYDDTRHSTFQMVLRAAEAYISANKLLLLRTSLIRHGIVVRRAELRQTDGGGGGGGSGGGGGGGSGSGSGLRPQAPFLPDMMHTQPPFPGAGLGSVDASPSDAGVPADADLVE